VIFSDSRQEEIITMNNGKKEPSATATGGKGLGCKTPYIFGYG